MTRKAQDFQRRRGKGRWEAYNKMQFSGKNIVEKFGIETNCYLTGEPVRLDQPETFHLDHIVPVSRGGDSSIDNLGIASPPANKAKHDLTVPEFIELCKLVLVNHGYRVEKKESGVIETQ